MTIWLPNISVSLLRLLGESGDDVLVAQVMSVDSTIVVNMFEVLLVFK